MHFHVGFRYPELTRACRSQIESCLSFARLDSFKLPSNVTARAIITPCDLVFYYFSSVEIYMNVFICSVTLVSLTLAKRPHTHSNTWTPLERLSFNFVYGNIRISLISILQQTRIRVGTFASVFHHALLLYSRTHLRNASRQHWG